MSTGVITKNAKVWRKTGKRGVQVATLKKGERVVGERNGDFFFLVSPVNGYTKSGWVKVDSVIVIPPVTPPPSEQPKRPYYMVPHDRMRYSYDKPDWRLNPARDGLARETSRVHGTQPEVYRVKPWHTTKLTSEWVNLLAGINPDLSDDKIYGLLDTKLAWCNNNWGEFDFPRFCGGAILTGETDPQYLFVRGLLTGGPVPSAAAVLADRTLWYYATGVQPDGDINYIQRKGKDGQDHPVRMFILSREPLYVRLDELLYLGDEFPKDYDPRQMR